MHFKVVRVKEHYPNFGPQTKFMKSTRQLSRFSVKLLIVFLYKQLSDSTTYRFIDVVYINYEQELSQRRTCGTPLIPLSWGYKGHFRDIHLHGTANMQYWYLFY